MWNAPGWVVEKAGVVGAVAVVDDAPESLASKTVAVRGRGRGGCRCRCRGCGEGGVVVVEVLWASASEYCLIAWVFEVRLQAQQQRKRTVEPR